MLIGAAEAPAACSVADAQPCTPTCSVIDGFACTRELLFPFSQDQRLLIQAQAPEQPRPARRSEPLNTLQELFSALESCWQPPPFEQSRQGTEITVRFSLTREGEILGEPRFTYMTPSLPSAVRSAYQRAIAETLKRCTPFPVSQGLGAAIAGRPISTRFIDD